MKRDKGKSGKMADSAPTGIRRIVTGHDKDGKAVVISDGPMPGVKTTPNRPGVVFHNMWSTESTPCRFDGPVETISADQPLPPPKNGTVFRIIEFPPEKQYIGDIDADKAKQAFSEYGAGGALDSSATTRHPFMHKTDTVDYGVVLDGEMVMILDDSEVPMKKGDVCIQRGTNHAWANRSDKPCTMLFVLIDGEGKREG